jgi:hypothetical protein
MLGLSFGSRLTWSQKGRQGKLFFFNHFNGRLKMSASNPHLQIGLRFCEVCGMFVGTLSKKDWDRAGHFCKECDEAYSQPLMLSGSSAKKEWAIYTN